MPWIEKIMALAAALSSNTHVTSIDLFGVDLIEPRGWQSLVECKFEDLKF